MVWVILAVWVLVGIGAYRAGKDCQDPYCIYRNTNPKMREWSDG